MSQIPEILKNKEVITSEIKSLTPQDIKDLATFIETNLVLDNKNTEEIVESIIEIAVAVINAVAKIKASPAPTVDKK